MRKWRNHPFAGVAYLLLVASAVSASPMPDPLEEAWRWKTFDRLSGTGPLCICEDTTGQIWFGTSQGVFVYDGLDWQQFTEADGLLSNKVTAVAAGPDGVVYAGGPSGVNVFDSGVWEPLLGDGGVPWEVTDISVTKSGDLWISTGWGAVQKSGNRLVLLTSPEMGSEIGRIDTGIEVKHVPADAIPHRPWDSGLGVRVINGIDPPAYVWRVHPKGPGGLAGIQPGDRIVEIDHSVEVLQNRLDGEPGTVARVKVYSGEVERTLHLTRVPAGELNGGEVPLAYFPVHTIREDKDGILWMGVSHDVWGGEILYYEPESEKFELFGADDGLSIGFRPSILHLKNNETMTVSFETGSDINVFSRRDSTWSRVRIDGSEFEGQTRTRVETNPSILQTTDGTIWVGGRDRVMLQRGSGWSLYHKDQYPVPSARINDMMEDSRGGVWLVGRGLAPVRIDYGDKQWQTYPNLEFWGERDGAKLFVRRDGSTPSVERWDERGRARVLGEPMDAPLKLSFGRSDAVVWVFGSHQGAGAVARFSIGVWERTVHYPFTIRVECLLEAANGDVWIGSTNDGFGLRYPKPDRPPGGAKVFSDGSWTRFDPITEAPGFSLCVAETPDGRIWMGGSSLRYFDGENWMVPDLPASLVSSDLNKTDVLHVDREGSLWVGSRAFGVFRLRDGIWTQFSSRDGLSGDQIVGIADSNRGGLLVATSNGISRFDGDTWFTEAIDKRVLPLREDGIHETPDGHIWLNRANNSVLRYAPDASGPETRIESSLRQVLSSEPATISWSGVDRWDNTPAGSLEFSWRVDEGVWSPYSNETGVSLLGLDAGEHRFEVRGRDRDYNIDTTPAILTFVVVLPFWTQPWFVGTVIVLVSLLAVQTNRIVRRDRVLVTTNADLERRSQELAREIERRRSIEADRTRLDVQLQHLRYLDTLRSALGKTQSPQDAIREAAKCLVSVFRDPQIARVHLKFDEYSYEFGERPSDASDYDRPLVWNDRTRGILTLQSPVELTESQERALLDETAGQISRVMEAQELGMQLLQSARLVSMGQMAAGVAHELNQPLGGISATAEDFYLRLQDGLTVAPDQWQLMLRRILGMVERMSETVEHLRVFSRDTALEPGVSYDLNQVVRDSLGIIGTQLQNHGIVVTASLESSLHELKGHPRQIEQVILNLLGNARDALDDIQKEVQDEIKEVVIRTYSSDGAAILEVADNGVGIEAEHLGRVFEPFYTTKPEDKGTGLGLSITYAIVKNHGGEITAESEVGVGTTFRVTLPVSREDAQTNA